MQAATNDQPDTRNDLTNIGASTHRGRASFILSESGSSNNSDSPHAKRPVATCSLTSQATIIGSGSIPLSGIAPRTRRSCRKLTTCPQTTEKINFHVIDQIDFKVVAQQVYSSADGLRFAYYYLFQDPYRPR